MNIGPVEATIILALFVGLVWGLIDVATRPKEAFAAAGSSKGLWLGLMIGGWFLCGIGGILGWVYLLAVRPKVRAAEGHA